MRKLMLLVLIGLAPLVQANDWTEKEKPVVCGPFREMVQNLMQGQYRETPLWIGQSNQDRTQFVLFSNIDTGTWTLVQYGTSTGCILGIGDSSVLTNPVQWPKKP